MSYFELKNGILQAVGEGTATVRLGTLMRCDAHGDVLEPGFFPRHPPLVVSIQPYHKHDVHSLGHALVRERGDEIIGDLFFNNTLAAVEHWKAIKWDFESPHGPIQEFSWGYKPKPGAARTGHFEGQPVRFLGKDSQGDFGCYLVEVSPTLKGASVNTGTISVRSQPLTPAQRDFINRLYRKVTKQPEAERLYRRFLASEDCWSRRRSHV